MGRHPILITSFFIRSSSFAVVKSPFEAVLPTDIVNLFQNKLIFKIWTLFHFTKWKFDNFLITQISREINFCDYRSAKSAIFTHLEALNFVFLILHFLKPEIYQINKIQSPKK